MSKRFRSVQTTPKSAAAAAKRPRAGTEPRAESEPREEEIITPARKGRKSSTKPKAEVEKKQYISEAKYLYDNAPTNFEPDEVTRLSQEHLESLKFKYFKYDPTDTLDDIMKNNPLLDVILGTKKFTSDYLTTTVDSEFPPDDKDERKLLKVSGPRLKNAALFDYYCKYKTFEKVTGTIEAPPTPQPSTSTETVDITMDE